MEIIETKLLNTLMTREELLEQSEYYGYRQISNRSQSLTWITSPAFLNGQGTKV